MMTTQNASNGEIQLVQYPASPHGTLSWKHGGKLHDVTIAFSLEVDRTGRISLDIQEQVLTNANSWVMIASSASSPILPALNLEARNAERLVIRSEAVHVTYFGTRCTENLAIICMKAETSELTVLADNVALAPASECEVEYLITGLRWFGCATFDTPAGQIAIAGSAKIDDYSKISGRVVIRSPANDKSLEFWLGATDAEVRRILDVVSFADGHFMRATVRQVFKHEKLVRIDFFGSRQDPPRQPPLHYLDFTNSLPPLIRHIDQALIDRTGLDVAIEWHLMPHVYDEARFVSQMTAIEHLIHVFSEHSPNSTYIPKHAFHGNVTAALTRTLKEQIAELGLDRATQKEAIENMVQGLKGINRRSLRSNLTRMLREYGVPVDGFSELIGSLIKKRNNIVHSGLHQRDDDGIAIGQRVAEVEELLRRIVFAYSTSGPIQDMAHKN